MAIKRRILRAHYKIYKKNFRTSNNIKINIMRNNTNLKIFLRTQKLAEKVEKEQYVNYLSFWQNLNSAEQQKEIEFTKNDIKIFSKYAQSMPLFKDEKFQSYLPKTIWKNMTQQQRKSHLQKRDAIIKKNAKLKKKYLSTKQPKLYFTNVKHRPWLTNISQRTKVTYLRILLKRAKIFIEKKTEDVKKYPALKTHPATQTIPLLLQHLVNFKNISKTCVKNKKPYIFQLLPKKKRAKKYA